MLAALLEGTPDRPLTLGYHDQYVQVKVAKAQASFFQPGATHVNLWFALPDRLASFRTFCHLFFLFLSALPAYTGSIAIDIVIFLYHPNLILFGYSFLGCSFLFFFCLLLVRSILHSVHPGMKYTTTSA